MAVGLAMLLSSSVLGSIENLDLSDSDDGIRRYLSGSYPQFVALGWYGFCFAQAGSYLKETQESAFYVALRQLGAALVLWNAKKLLTNTGDARAIVCKF